MTDLVVFGSMSVVFFISRRTIRLFVDQSMVGYERFSLDPRGCHPDSCQESTFNCARLQAGVTSRLTRKCVTCFCAKCPCLRKGVVLRNLCEVAKPMESAETGFVVVAAGGVVGVAGAGDVVAGSGTSLATTLLSFHFRPG